LLNWSVLFDGNCVMNPILLMFSNGFFTIKSGIHPADNIFNMRRQMSKHMIKLLGNFFPGNGIAATLPAANEFPCLGNGADYRLIGLLASMSGIVPYARVLLITVYRLNGCVGIDMYPPKSDIARFPHTSLYFKYNLAQLVFISLVKTLIEEPPETALHRYSFHIEYPLKNRIIFDILDMREPLISYIQQINHRKQIL